MDYRLHNFKLAFPHIFNKMIGYREVNDFDLLVTLEGGKKILYDDFDKTFRALPKDVSDMSEEECKSEFAYRLRTHMKRKLVSQRDLSDMTGISQSTLSRYLVGISIPSFYKADKIAKALGCSVDEFRYY
jgi:DNA-binding Xre family transcriptional regulator